METKTNSSAKTKGNLKTKVTEFTPVPEIIDQVKPVEKDRVEEKKAQVKNTASEFDIEIAAVMFGQSVRISGVEKTYVEAKSVKNIKYDIREKLIKITDNDGKKKLVWPTNIKWAELP